MKLLVITLFFLICASASSLKILGILPIHGRSHFYPMDALMQGLAKAGHSVTFVTPFKPKSTDKNLEYFTLDGPELPGELLSFSDIETWFGKGSVTDFSVKLFGVFVFQNASKATCEIYLNSDKTKDFLKKKQHYDVVIAEAFHTDCFFGFANHFGAPLVHFTASLPMPWYNNRFGQPSNPSYIPNVLTGFTMQMTFFERLQNVIVDTFHQFYYDWLQEPGNYKRSKQFFGDELPDYDVIAKNASLLFTNSHFSLTGARPYVPNVIEVGGIHVATGPKKVPQEYITNIPK